MRRIKLDVTGAEHGEWLPQVGLAIADGFESLDEKSIHELKSLQPRHLRLDLDLSSAGWHDKLTAYTPNIAAVGRPLEVALKCPEHPQRALQDLAAAWPKQGLPVVLWLILASKGVTGKAQIEPAREALSNIQPQALFGGGTDAEFVAVNRQHPPMEHLDLLTLRSIRRCIPWTTLDHGESAVAR